MRLRRAVAAKAHKDSGRAEPAASKAVWQSSSLLLKTSAIYFLFIIQDRNIQKDKGLPYTGGLGYTSPGCWRLGCFFYPKTVEGSTMKPFPRL